jgi:hypothetical protein
MADFGIGNSANNFGRSAGLLANTTALRPVQAAEGTIFVDVETLLIYRYDAINEAGWQEIGGGGGISLATNGLSIYDNIAIGLGGSLTQPETIIEGNTFLWRTISQGYQQGFYLNFDGQIYSFGISENNDGDVAFTSYSSSNIFTQIYNENSLGSITINHGANDYFITREYDYYDGTTTSYNIFGANYFETYISQNYTFVDDEENTIVVEGRIRIICDEQQLVHYNLLNIPVYTDNAAALAAGLIVGDLYRHDNPLEAGDQLRIVH